MTFINTTLPPSQEFMQWGWTSRSILGNGTGKFRQNPQNLFLNQKVILVDVGMGSLMNVAMSVPHLNTVLSTGAELFSLAEITHRNKAGEVIEDSKLMKFLKHPNPLQSLEQYLYEFYILNGVYNKTFQHQIKGLSYERLPSAMWLLPSGFMKINTTGKIYRQTDINEIIESYELMDGGHLDKYEVKDVIYMAEGVGNSILNPVSRIEALQIPLSNIVASLKSTNIIITERGMIGFVTPEPEKSAEMQQPYNDGEHERVRKEYQRQYNMDGQGGHVGFPKVPMRWVPMTFDVKQLGLSETNEEAFSQVIAAYRHDRDIYPSTKGATYENKAAGMRSTVQNGLQPLIDKLMRQFTKSFIDEKTGEYLQASYEHLPSMQEDKVKEEQAKKINVERLSIMLKDNVIDHESYAEEADVEMTGTAEAPQPTPMYAGNPKQNEQER